MVQSQDFFFIVINPSIFDPAVQCQTLPTCSTPFQCWCELCLVCPALMACNHQLHLLSHKIRFSFPSLCILKSIIRPLPTATTFPLRSFTYPSIKSSSHSLPAISSTTTSSSTCSFTWDDVVRVAQPEYAKHDSSDLAGFFEKINSVNRGSVILPSPLFGCLESEKKKKISSIFYNCNICRKCNRSSFHLSSRIKQLVTYTTGTVMALSFFKIILRLI